MKVYGIDFTSAPSHRKPITCADCILENGFLHFNDIKYLETFDQFDEFLASGTEWIAGMDFPFGQPRKLICNLRWPLSWEGYVGIIDKMDKQKFENMLKEYGQQRPEGDKHHFRETDKKAGSRSPMMLVRVPVGKMFFQGAPRLLKSGVSILPCHKNGSRKIVVEAYPKLVAKKLISKPQYKNDTNKKQTSQFDARREIMKKLKSDIIRFHYGFNVELKEDLTTKIIDDNKGDCLDALLCAIQAGWAHEQRELGYGIPEGFELEGWIVDPELNDR
ncbi:Protein of unknown function (DUF429) [Candidatus Methanoperedens nitroreducens]|uniref:DUF429 domain-containing protein n=1 Tax=Candidatus Methanoperedens nitratireducens TaxID=1392998 RepID=A0A062V3U7_9EURY|nr:DUF429 domain-containing protein [Candidatus Methanoperedens nitroreducens]KCZ72002.1 Protein of unknown function (DUF429) [Candidatus Methanoperedens nitroreducens]MDJ1422022.1 DUF429 domain-containing protein [Candidatus Methanoperedens sp.]